MLSNDILTMLIRELDKLEEELTSYRRENDIWKVLPGTINTAGNLALHLTGNLRHFIGAVLGETGYVRDRDLEFSSGPVPLEEIRIMISFCREEISKTLMSIDPARLDEPFPKEIGGQVRSGAFILLHLLAHFNYHLGQVNYHRRYFNQAEG